MYEVELFDEAGQVLYVCLATGREAVRSLLRQVWRPRLGEAVVRKDGVEVYRWERACPACRSGSGHVEGCPFESSMRS